jgi:SPOR domain
MAGNDDIPTGFGDGPGRKMRTYQREDMMEAAPADNEGLEFENGPARLPWLESDDEPYELERPDSGRILGFGLLGLVALAALIGGIWWATHRKTDSALVADGSTVAAPSAPFKVPPEDPGGKKFDGTGDSAFAVSEGQNRPVTLGEGAKSAPGTAIVTTPEVAPPVAPLAVPSKAPANPSLPVVKPVVPAPVASMAPRRPVAAPMPEQSAVRGPVVQVGAYSTRASADAAWSRMAGKYAALSGQRHQVVEGQADIGKVYRLQVISGDSSSANALCGKLKSGGLACQVKN